MSALVELTQFGVRTNSRTVADVFEKHHKDVLRTIDGILEKKPELRGRNFTPTVENVDSGATSRHLRYFEMDRDGFTLVAMGFTGEKALDWKLAYIDAFNRMESVLIDAEPETDQMGKVDLDSLETLGPALAIVREARQLFGRPAARRLWPRLGLPDPGTNSEFASIDGRVTSQCEILQEWLRDRTVGELGARTESLALYADYRNWCKERGDVPHSNTRFGSLLKTNGFEKIKSNRTYRLGIRLID